MSKTCNNCRYNGNFEKCYIAKLSPGYAEYCRTYQKRQAAYPNTEFEAAVREMEKSQKSSLYGGLYIDRSRR